MPWSRRRFRLRSALSKAFWPIRERPHPGLAGPLGSFWCKSESPWQIRFDELATCRVDLLLFRLPELLAVALVLLVKRREERCEIGMAAQAA